MAQDWSKHLYASPAWKKNRAAYLQTPVDRSGHRLYTRYVDGSSDPEYYWVDEYGYEVVVAYENIVPPGMCERCFAKGEIRPAKLVHHITHVSQENVTDPHITLSFDNFQRLCQDCHAEVHASGQESRVNFDALGNVVWKVSDGTA